MPAATTTATAISLRDLRKVYGDHVVIADLSMEIREGEFFTLLGPSGCGKTTLLRMIAGFNSIEGGTISFNGEVINDLAPAARNIGMVFQNYALFPQMTAAKNVAFGLENRHVPKPEISPLVDTALGDVHMETLKDRLPGMMSGGQQQRVALARALVIKPAVLLMDEPLSNLDAKLRVEMRTTIRDIQHRAGITTVYVTHDQEEAMSVSDRIAVMNEGVVQQLGTPPEIYHRPANLFVAGFIGKTNTLRRTVRRAGGRTLVLLDASHPLDITDQTNPAAVGDEVVVSVRPEAAAVAGTGVPATIVDQTFLGGQNQVRAELAGGDVMEFMEFSRGVTHAWTPGQPVTLEFDQNRLNFFDPGSGESVMAAPR
ncbi:MAG: ABC transporter ATP-binding protein [Propionibacteriaceae bacterium]|jgi:iron(III) transport system ATP-binding protein|nr:ABC transporter ATP-binding protein [Propionibacteriaceae bacterium]